MPTEITRVYDADGILQSEQATEVPEAPIDPIEDLQAQVDALTDIVLGGAA